MKKPQFYMDFVGKERKKLRETIEELNNNSKKQQAQLYKLWCFPFEQEQKNIKQFLAGRIPLNHVYLAFKKRQEYIKKAENCFKGVKK